MKNYIQPGNVIDIIAAAALTSGQAFPVGCLLAVPVIDGVIGQIVPSHIEGVFELPKLSSAAFTAGQSLRWKVSTKQFSTTGAATGDLEGCAVAIAAAPNPSATVLVKLCPGNATVTP